MKLSISNIGWPEEDDPKMYKTMKEMGFSGLEIAPTRIFPENPYDNIPAAKEWSDRLLSDYGLVVSSMQSIWYGRPENIFGSEAEKETLIDYTKKAIDFAEAAGCKNLVFGSPRNRSIHEGRRAEEAIPFFREIAGYAGEHRCVVAMEANPPIYNTNFINTTEQALELVREVASDGFRLNLDVGTMIENGESISVLKGNEAYIHHVHISEPALKPIEKREFHRELAGFLADRGYDGFISIEVGKQDDIEVLASMMEYVKEIFG